ncbi:unnamed protein product, partial [Mesorhabditis spiculigera]
MLKTDADMVRFEPTHSRKKRFVYQENTDRMSFDSTDPFAGYTCFNDDAVWSYLNRDDVQKAIHAKIYYKGADWEECSDRHTSKYFHYYLLKEYYDMSNTFNAILDSKWYTSNQMSLLIYNGDVDTICQFLGDEWFMEALVLARNMTVIQQRSHWYYQEGSKYENSVAGFAKRWSNNVAQMTIKGSGHFVPMDRPAFALQMITNYLAGQTNYSTPLAVDITPAPLLPAYAYTDTPVTNCSRKDQDRFYSLPGGNFDSNFNQYSGYLDATATHKLHYILLEAEWDPSTAPLLLWLNGGPGSSSLVGLFQENGPYRVGRDGKSLFQNHNAWNKFANVLYLESPVGVGYSYSIDPNETISYNDNNTATVNYAALRDFFMNAYPEYQTRDFYITGESYAGVYLPTLAVKLINGIKAADIKANFKGMVVGNGVLDKNTDLNSIIHLQYYSGLYSYNDYTDLVNTCCPGNSNEFACQFSDHVVWGDSVIPDGNSSDPCFNKLSDFILSGYTSPYDRYNMYQDCYNTPSNGIRAVSNYNSSDPYDGYYCYMDTALEKYLNLPEVMTALNIPSAVKGWNDNDDIFDVYIQQNIDQYDNFAKVFDYGAKVLIYNGDVDMACNFLGAQWFAAKLQDKLKLHVDKARENWYYRQDPNYEKTVAGSWIRYTSYFDVITVKGSGHYVPLDRPMHALQMIYNFVYYNDYSTPFPAGPTTTPGPTTPVPTTVTGATVTGSVGTTIPTTATGATVTGSVGTTVAQPTTTRTSSQLGFHGFLIMSTIIYSILRF